MIDRGFMGSGVKNMKASFTGQFLKAVFLAAGLIAILYSFSSAASCSKRLLAYYPYWNSGYRADKIQYSKLTHICHAFAEPNADGTLYLDPGPPALIEPALITNAHAAGVKVMISIGGASSAGQPPDSTFRTISQSAALRTAFANNIASFCATYGYDGVDIDWEMPGAMDPTDPGATDRSNFNLMIQAIRTAFNSTNPAWLISIATSSDNWGAQWLDYATLSNSVDFYNDMTYDMHGSWNATMGYNAPLYQGNYAEDNLCGQTCMDYMLTTRGVPAAKVNFGIPFYGQYYPGSNTLFYTCGNCATTEANYNAIAPLIGSGWTYHWDAASQVPYLTNNTGAGIYSYDDAQSVGLKADYALNSRNAGGIFMWDLSEDYMGASNEPLLDAMYTKFSPFCSANSPTFTFTYTRTATPTSSRTATRTVTSSMSFTPTATRTATPTLTSSIVPTFTASPSRTATLTATDTRQPTTTNTSTPTPANTSTVTPIATCWNLVWSDEFNGPSIDAANWNYETGCSGWGNNELENYTNAAANSYIQGGNLVISAINTGGGSCGYTSARMTTKGKVHFTYGRIEARIQCPYSQGLWPAFWMLGSDIDTVPWPGCGEIDILEMIGGGTGRDNVCYGTAHWDNGGHQQSGGNTSVVWPARLSDAYHVYAIEWDAVSIKWFFDGVQYYSLNTTAAGMEEFQAKDFFIILNVAVGGTWPGNPDGTSVFPQVMNVDYVRWYQQGACVGTPTFTPTANSTVSYSPTPSFSRTGTPGATRTVTATASPSFTPTSTATPSRTRTATGTATPTYTESPVVSPTETWTGTPPTETVTPTTTETGTDTPVDTVTETATPTSIIPSPSASAPVSPSKTFTETPTTQNPSKTATPTESSTFQIPDFTATITLTIPETRTPTPGLTATLDSGHLTLDSILIYPNPYNSAGGDLTFQFDAMRTAAKIKVRIYTMSLRRVIEEDTDGNFTGISTVSIAARKLSSLANGAYYVVLLAETGAGEKTVSKPVELVVLK
jgi:GH18 family chitinase/beta-glucanase (GH16 family)